MTTIETYITAIEENTAAREEKNPVREGMSSDREGMSSDREEMSSAREGMSSDREEMSSDREEISSDREGMSSDREGMVAARKGKITAGENRMLEKIWHVMIAERMNRGREDSEAGGWRHVKPSAVFGAVKLMLWMFCFISTMCQAASAKSADAMRGEPRITEQRIANGTITEQQIANGTITEQRIANGAVAEQRLANRMVAEQRFASGEVAEAVDARVEFADEGRDTVAISRILAEECMTADAGDVERIAKGFIGVPYKGGTLEGEPERVRIDLGGMDCTTFVENVLGLAYTARSGRASWRDFVDNLESMRYHNGRMNGYASRLHYPSEWVIENVSRGKLKEITGDLPGMQHVVKTLDFITRNASLYPALSDSITLAEMKMAEARLHNFRFPVVKYGGVKNKALAPLLRSGDVVLFTTAKKGLDVSHMGIIVMDGGVIKFLHASSKEGKVVIDKLSLEEYVRKNRNDGIRIVRLTRD